MQSAFAEGSLRNDHCRMIIEERSLQNAHLENDHCGILACKIMIVEGSLQNGHYGMIIAERSVNFEN